MIETVTYWLDGLFRDAVVGVAVIDEEGQLVCVNPKLAEMLGFTLQELNEHSVLQYTQEEDHARMRKLLTRVRMNPGSVGQEDKLRMIRKSGEPMQVEVRCSHAVAASETIVGQRMMLLLQIVECQERREVTQVLTEHTLDMIVRCSPDKKLTYVSPASLRLLGYRPEELIGVDSRSPVHPEDQLVLSRYYADADKVPDERVTTFRYRRKDGSYVWFEAFTKSIRDHATGQLLEDVSVFRDITERKQAEVQLMTSEKLSTAGQTAAAIAHEIRNPLTSLKGFLQLMQSGYGEKAMYYDIMTSELERIEDILNELLLLAKPQQPRFREADLVRLLQQTVTLLESHALLNGVEIVTDFSVDEIRLNCDVNQLKQVFINLGKNGIEAMPGGGVLQIRAYVEQSEAVIMVVDEGVGLPEERLQQLGEPFYTTKESGTGLGLMVSYNIIQQNHRGSITVESCLNRGTTFQIKLPMSKDREVINAQGVK